MCYAIMDKFAFRRYGNSSKRDSIDKAIFEVWCICLNNRTEEEIDCLVRQKELLQEKFGELLSSAEFFIWVKAGDKPFIVERITESICGSCQLTSERKQDNTTHVDWWIYMDARNYFMYL